MKKNPLNMSRITGRLQILVMQCVSCMCVFEKAVQGHQEQGAVACRQGHECQEPRAHAVCCAGISVDCILNYAKRVA
jgi:hypothetical protein